MFGTVVLRSSQLNHVHVMWGERECVCGRGGSLLLRGSVREKVWEWERDEREREVSEWVRKNEREWERGKTLSPQNDKKLETLKFDCQVKLTLRENIQ